MKLKPFPVRVYLCFRNYRLWRFAYTMAAAYCDLLTHGHGEEAAKIKPICDEAWEKIGIYNK